MGAAAVKAAVPADALQAALVAARAAGALGRQALVKDLPRASQHQGRFVLDREVFTDMPVETPSFFKWQRTKESVVTPSADELERLLPVRTPDAEALAAPPQERMQVLTPRERRAESERLEYSTR